MALGNRGPGGCFGIFAPGICTPKVRIVAVILAADLFQSADHQIVNCRVAIGQRFGQGLQGRFFLRLADGAGSRQADVEIRVAE